MFYYPNDPTNSKALWPPFLAPLLEFVKKYDFTFMEECYEYNQHR